MNLEQVADELAEIDAEIGEAQTQRAAADAAARAEIVGLKKRRDVLVARRDALTKVDGLNDTERAELAAALNDGET